MLNKVPESKDRCIFHIPQHLVNTQNYLIIDHPQKKGIGHFEKYHNTLFCPPQIFHKLCFQVLLGLTNGAKRIHKQCLGKILADNEEYYGFFPKWPIVE